MPTRLRQSAEARRALPPALQQELDEASPEATGFAATCAAAPTTMSRFVAALRELSQSEPRLFSERMEELAYLVNVLLAGHECDGARLRPNAAADAVLATVCYGATIGLRTGRTKDKRTEPPTAADFAAALQQRPVDLLFRAASSALATGAAPQMKGSNKSGLLYSAEELEAAVG